MALKKYFAPCSLTLLLLLVVGIHAQDPAKESMLIPDHDSYFVESVGINSASGPFAITRNILEDRRGHIWLATWHGVMRYDGEVFTNHTNRDSLMRYRAFALLEDRNGHIWIGTVGAGVYRYDGVAFHHYTMADGLINHRVGALYEDRNGHLWIGTEEGISRYDGVSFQNFTSENGLPNDQVNAIVQDQDGAYWIGTRGGTCTFNGETFRPYNQRDGSPFMNVRSIIADRSGHVWLGGNDGLWQCRRDGSQAQIASQFTGYIYQDRSGHIWTSSETPGDRGRWMLTRYHISPLPYAEVISTEILTRDDMFFGILEDRGGGIWLGTLHGAGRYDGHTFEWFRGSDGHK